MIKYCCDLCKKEVKENDLKEIQIPDYSVIEYRGGLGNVPILSTLGPIVITKKEICPLCQKIMAKELFLMKNRFILEKD